MRGCVNSSLRLSAALLLASGLGHPAPAASYNFVKIADTDGPYSGFNVIGVSDSGLPSINSAGTVGFWAKLDAGGEGIYAGDGGAVTTYALTGATYDAFGRGLPAINNFGHVAFTAHLTGTGSSGNVIRRVAPTVVGSATIASGDSAFSSLHDWPSISPTSGQVAFGGSRVITPPFSTPGVWRGDGGEPTEIATGTSSIFGPGGVSINSLNNVAWIGSYGAAGSGVHVSSGASVSTWVDLSGPFSGFGLVCSINSPPVAGVSPKVAFFANHDAGGSGVYTVERTTSGFLITPIATDPSISVFSNPSINTAGLVVFRRIVGGADALYTGPDLALHRVVGDGDALDLRIVSDVRSGKQAVNDRGDIAFRAIFTDGSSGIFRAVACPADVTGNHVVNVDDLLAVISAWGATGGAADVTRDGVVNVNDLLLVIAAWGPCPTL